MPAYNIASLIAANIKKTKEVFDKLGWSFEIIVVDDGSSDETFLEAQRIAREMPMVKAISLPGNQGKGWALKEGFSIAGGEFIIFLDGDLDIQPDQIGLFFEIMEKDKAEVVIGSKRHPQSKLDYPWGRRVLSSVYFFLVKVLFGLPIHDTQTGLKLFKRKVLEEVFPRILVKRYAFDLELLVNAYHLGYAIREAPVVVDFKGRFGRITPKDIYDIWLDTLAIFYRLRILKYYDRDIPLLKDYPFVSIIIPLGEQEAELSEGLKRVSVLDYPEYEIIVLPNVDLTLSYPHLKVVATGPLSPPEKRDIGLRAAQGEIIAFLDVDAYPGRDWLKNGLRFLGPEEVAAVGGPAVTPREDNLRQKASGNIYSSWLVGGSYNYRYIPRLAREVEDYPTSNLLVKRKVLEKIGGFGTSLWPGEDTYLCRKIIKETGKKIIYEPGVLVYHHRRPLFLPHLRQVSNYALHRGYFAKIYPENSRHLSYFLPSLLVIYLSLGWWPGLFFPWLRGLYIGGIIFYLSLVFLTALRHFNPFMIFLVFTGIIATHFVYGVKFLQGLLTRELRK